MDGARGANQSILEKGGTLLVKRMRMKGRCEWLARIRVWKGAIYNGQERCRNIKRALEQSEQCTPACGAEHGHRPKRTKVARPPTWSCLDVGESKVATDSTTIRGQDDIPGCDVRRDQRFHIPADILNNIEGCTEPREIEAPPGTSSKPKALRSHMFHCLPAHRERQLVVKLSTSPLSATKPGAVHVKR